MTTDLETQRERAEALVEILRDFVDVDLWEEDGEVCAEPVISAEMVLDALGCCGFVLQPGEDAGKAFIDGFIRKLHSRQLK